MINLKTLYNILYVIRNVDKLRNNDNSYYGKELALLRLCCHFHTLLDNVIVHCRLCNYRVAQQAHPLRPLETVTVWCNSG